MNLFDGQVRLLDLFSPEFRGQAIEANHTGDLVDVDTFLVGSLKVRLTSVHVVGHRLRQPSGQGRLYASKLPLSAVDVLNKVWLPFFEEHDDTY